MRRETLSLTEIEKKLKRRRHLRVKSGRLLRYHVIVRRGAGVPGRGAPAARARQQILMT